MAIHHWVITISLCCGHAGDHHGNRWRSICRDLERDVSKWQLF